MIVKERMKRIASHESEDKYYKDTQDKEIVHPHVHVRIPCYDLTPVSVFTVDLRIARRA